ncbi:MAG: ISL3 family transposase [Oligoflexus sp.]
MEDKELYQHLLGLKTPWTVKEVKLNVQAEEIAVQVNHPRGTKFCCPECQRELPCYDHGEERRWRHLDSCQFKTILIAQVPRVNCPEHGVKSVSVPWAEPHSRFTILFERFAIDVLCATQTVKNAMSILRLKWDATWHIIERAVARGKARKEPSVLPRIGIDEKAFAKGHSYVSMVYDLDNSTVEAISDGHDTEAAVTCFSQLSEAQIQSVEAIAMDMSPAYVKAAKQCIPLAENKIVHDIFHVMQLANKAVDKVRKAEHRQLKGEGDDQLTGSKYLWLTSYENLTLSQVERFESLCNLSLETGRAWSYKELLRDLWAHETEAEAKSFFKQWYNRVIHTKLEPMKKLARTLKERIDNIVTYCTHGVTNSVAEGINSKIMSIKRRAGGFRNRENFKIAIFFYCGGLDLHPR